MVFDIDGFLRAEGLPAGYRDQIARHWVPLAKAVVARRHAVAKPIVVGICGSQGSGKSTLAKLLTRMIAAEGSFRAAQFSLDDLYLSRADRHRLAAEVHPLLATRGVPGTHDVSLGIQTIEALKRGDGDTSMPLPAFDKASDDRRPLARWQQVAPPVDIILFEGWCVGARPQPTDALAAPINALERDEDSDARWRRHVNDQLDGPYRALFDLLDHLVYLKAPDFAAVRRWRGKQESKLQRAVAASDRADQAGGVMDNAALDRFLLFYERITRHLFDTMPGHADTTYLLDNDQGVASRIDVTPFLSRPTDATL